MSASDGWHDWEVPAQQDALATGEYAAWKAGARHGPFDALRRLIPRCGPIGSVLEVGVGAGYHARYFAEQFPAIVYGGCDYAPAMVDHARAHYPGSDFQVADQRNLPYPDASRDAVISGCCLLHLRTCGDWLDALQEAARVSRRWVLLHRTPVRAPGAPTVHTEKVYYGVAIHETHVAGAALAWLLEDAGLREVATEVWNLCQDPEMHSILCEKIR